MYAADGREGGVKGDDNKQRGPLQIYSLYAVCSWFDLNQAK
jgi:hypothetical protein